jgi:raffinose/stachyose/melibiose transport system substrate-binding protein
VKRWTRWCLRHTTVLVVPAVFVWACATVAARRAAEAPPGTITLRIGHWQLETGVREALDAMARDYRQLHPNVRIVQDAIPDLTYGQWTTTQLMGGTAPDLMQIGKLPYPLLVQYFNRYYVPLSRYADAPNPYNRGTDLETEPLRSTLKDGMRESYIEEVQEFMTVPLAQFGVRIFYNRDLLRRLTGRDQPPQEYRDFLAVCAQIRAGRDARGQPYVPIACSRVHLPAWEGPLLDPLTFPLMHEADFNRDGLVGNDELYVAVRTGRLSFRHPAIAARFSMLRELSQYFPDGYTGLTREEALFLFAQQRAVFITTGSWDVRSIEAQAAGEFAVGVMEYPRPLRSDPVYGRFVAGPNYERISAGFPFGITRTCRHPEIAADFLLFMASRKGNERLNAIIGWIPSVRGARVLPSLQAFEPHLRGVYGCFNPNLGAETSIRWLQLTALFQVGQLTFEDLTARFEPFYREHGLRDFLEQQRDWRRAMQNNEQMLAAIRAAACAGDGPAARSAWVRYRTYTAARQVLPEIAHAGQLRLVEGKIPVPERMPYAYSEATLERVRQNMAGAQR